jgi:pSer/pThr/pTyr-binding forkhead associated (FHA) protein
VDVHLTVVAGPRAGLEYRARGKTAITLGRSKTTDFHILDLAMSRVHAVVARGAEGWYVADQKSRNGVWLGAERVERRRLESGMAFRLGKDTVVRFDLVDDDGPASRASVTVRVTCARCGEAIASSADLVRGPDGRPFHLPCRDLEHLVGAEIGGFKVTEALPPRDGAFFFRAHQPTLNRTVVLQVFDPPVTSRPGFRDALLEEVRRASRFLHPNVLQIYDFGEARGMCFVVTERFGGEPLAQVLAERRFVKIREAVSVALQIAEALEYAREQGSLEPWITCSSVLVSAEHEVKVKLFREPALASAGIRASDAVYVAPEVLAGTSKGQDPSAVVYSIGAILYHMLAGISPVEGETTAEVARRAQKDSPPALRRINLKVSPALAQAVEAAIDRRPEARPQSIEGLIEVLKKAAAPGR